MPAETATIAQPIAQTIDGCLVLKSVCMRRIVSMLEVRLKPDSTDARGRTKRDVVEAGLQAGPGVAESPASTFYGD
jgi:hypothetical protein